MRFFIDTAKVEDIKKANDMGVICGVTLRSNDQSLSDRQRGQRFCRSDQRDCIHRRWTHQW